MEKESNRKHFEKYCEPGHPKLGGRQKKITTGAERIEKTLDAILERVLEQALNGDMHACDILLRFYSKKELVL